MEHVDEQKIISAAIEGFLAGLKASAPDVGFGRSEVFDSAIWSLFSLLEGNSEQATMKESLTKRIPIILECESLSPQSRQMLEQFRESGDLQGGGDSIRSDALPRTLGVALCESVRERRVERAAEVVAMTHFSPISVQASIALVEFQAALLVGCVPDEAVELALEVVEHPEIRAALQVDKAIGSSALSSDDSVVEVIRWVVWATHQRAELSLILEAVTEGSERNPVVTSLCGAALGSQGRTLPASPCADLRSEEIAEQIVYCRRTLSSRS